MFTFIWHLMNDQDIMASELCSDYDFHAGFRIKFTQSKILIDLPNMYKIHIYGMLEVIFVLKLFIIPSILSSKVMERMYSEGHCAEVLRTTSTPVGHSMTAPDRHLFR